MDFNISNINLFKYFIMAHIDPVLNTITMAIFAITLAFFQHLRI